MSVDEREVIRPELIEYSVDGVRMHRAADDPSLEFVLGIGTVAEQALQWPDGWPTGSQSQPMLSQWWRHTDDQLRRLRTHFAEPHKGRSQNICLVDGIWLVWCYASTDIKNLYLQLGEQNDEIEALKTQVRELSEAVGSLRAAVGSLRIRIGHIDGDLP